MRVLLSLVLVFSMAVTACDDGGGGGGVDTTQAEDTPAGDAGTSTVADLTGRAYRITVLNSTEPTTLLNTTFAMDIATYVNVLVFHIVEHNMEDGYLMMTAGPCSTEFVDPDAEEPVAKAFRYALPVEPFRVEMDGLKFVIEEPAVLDMMFETLSDSYRVDRLLGSGVIREDLSGIDEGDLAGGILLETAINLCTTIPGFGVVNFHWFLTNAHICPNFDTGDDGEMDAYYFAGTFNAEDATDLFVPGEIVPIESIVEECNPHDDPCYPVD